MSDRSCLLQDLADLESDAIASASEASCRAAARTIPPQLVRRQPLRCLRLWLANYRTASDCSRPFCTGLRMGHLLVLFTGLVSGWSTAAVVLFYDGSAPVNILHAVVILALIPLLLSLPFYLGLLIPAQRLQDVFRVLTPGRWTLDLWQYLQSRRRSSAPGTAFVIPLSVGHHLAVWWTQLFSLGFAIGSLLELFYQVSIFDLAFAWSTTLNLSAAQFQQVTNILAWPWSWWLPHAVPSTVLIEASQYFRLKSGTLQVSNSAIQMTQWWPFLLISISSYSLLPRLLSTVLAGWRLRRCLCRQLLHSSTARRLLQLLDSHSVSTRAPMGEAITPQAIRVDSTIPGVEQLPDSCRQAVVINWSAANDFAADALEQLGQQHKLTVLSEFAAGGQVTLMQERQIPARIQALFSEVIWLRVKAWEPPLLEHQRFLRQLRETVGGQIPLLVTLIGLPDSDAQQDRMIWEQALVKLQDPAIYSHFVIGQIP